jgi:hypothetical protein
MRFNGLAARSLATFGLLAVAGGSATAQVTAPQPANRPIRIMTSPMPPAPVQKPNSTTQSGSFSWTCSDVLRVVANYSFSFQCQRDTGEVVLLEVAHGYDETGGNYSAAERDSMTTLDAERTGVIATVVTQFFREKSANPSTPIKLSAVGVWSKSEPGKPRVTSVTLQR